MAKISIYGKELLYWIKNSDIVATFAENEGITEDSITNDSILNIPKSVFICDDKKYGCKRGELMFPSGEIDWQFWRDLIEHNQVFIRPTSLQKSKVIFKPPYTKGQVSDFLDYIGFMKPANMFKKLKHNFLLEPHSPLSAPSTTTLRRRAYWGPLPAPTTTRKMTKEERYAKEYAEDQVILRTEKRARAEENARRDVARAHRQHAKRGLYKLDPNTTYNRRRGSRNANRELSAQRSLRKKLSPLPKLKLKFSNYLSKRPQTHTRRKKEKYRGILLNNSLLKNNDT